MKIDIKKMSYVDFMAFLGEVNRPPGGKNSIRQLVLNSFLDSNSKVLDVGCNTGYCTFEIAHLAKCKTIGLDINPLMIKEANKILKKEKNFYKTKISFKTGNAQKIPFDDNFFDLVMSGGSTVFIPDKEKTFEEYKRVCKPWGFIGDIIFYYHHKPPQKLLKKLNNILGFKIEPWDKKYWLEFYNKTGLELYYNFTAKTETKNKKEIREYVSFMTNKNTSLDYKQKKEIFRKLYPIMELFNQNQAYLNYGVFIFRKRLIQEEPSLFGY